MNCQTNSNIGGVVDVNAFWNTREDLALLAPPLVQTQPPALERLGPSPFPRSRFPFLGFLATVYDHVASHAGMLAARTKAGALQTPS